MAPIHKTDHVILHNRYILYIIFFIALGNLLSFAYVNDYYSVAVFVLLAFLTTFFSKNMIVIFSVAIVFSNLIKYGSRIDTSNIEGFSESLDGDFADSDEYVQPTEEPSNTTEPSKKTTKTPSKKKDKTLEPSKNDKTLEPSKKTTEPSKKTTEPSKKDKTLEPAKKTSELSLETDNKEKFGQDKDIVYTSEEQREIDETDKIIISQERILSSINKYKPLLDTLNGLTKNMNDVKSAASIFSSS